MSITIGPDYVSSNSDLLIQPSGTTAVNFSTSGTRTSSKVPAFNCSGSGGWYYKAQMADANEWIEANISGWTWSVNQQGAGAYGFDKGRYYAPVSGRYYFYASSYMYCDTNATSCYLHFQLAKNGTIGYSSVGRTPYNIYGHGTGNGYVDGIVTAAEMVLTQGQYVSIVTPGQRANSRTHGNHTLFCGCLMG